ncbi:MAG: hypothetical protein AAF206_30910, partial [Bacteroidota bacterium]
SGSAGNHIFGGNTYPGFSSSDPYVAKLDQDGNYLWVQVMPNGASNQDIAVDPAGNVFVSGQTYTDSTAIDTFDIADFEHYIFMLNTDGEAQWIKRMANTNIEYINRLAIDPSGNLLAFGTYYYFGAASFDGFTLPNVSGATSNNLFLAKMNNTGTTQWVETLVSQQPGFYGGTQAGAITTDSVDGIYIGGGYSNVMKANNTGADLVTSIGDSTDAFVAKYGSTGSLEWISSGGGTGDETVTGLAVTANMNGSWVYALGDMTSTSNFGAINLDLSTGRIFLLRMNHLGSFLSGINEAPNLYANSRDLQINQKLNLVIGGLYIGAADFSGTILPATTAFYSHGFVANYDTSLTLNWASAYGTGPNGSQISDISLGNDGRIFANGSFTGNGTFDTFSATSAGNNDAFIICLEDSLCPLPIVFPTDSVWPGDTDYDGIANNFDLLPIGLAYNDMGLTRPNASLSWIGQPAQDWNTSLPSGLDKKHVDVDGNGTIDAADTMGIFLNYGLTHNKFGGGSKTGLPIFLSFEDDTLFAGDTTDVIIHLGTDSLPADSVYGLAFSVMYDSSLIDPFNISVSYTNSWLGNNDVNMLSMERNFPNEEQIDFALTRIDQTNMNGYGEIGRMTIIMVDDLTAKMPRRLEFRFSLSI